MLGAEADITFGSLGGMPHDRSLGLHQYFSDFAWFGTVRGRAGQAFGRFLPYVTGGVTWGRNKLSIATPDDDEAGLFRTHWGWTAGFGLEYAVDGHWSLKGEYLYADFNSRTYGRLFFGDAADSLVPFRPSVSAFKLGMNYRWQDGEPLRAAAGKGMVLKAPPPSDADDWSIHAQTTFIEQGYFKFTSPYRASTASTAATRRATPGA